MKVLSAASLALALAWTVAAARAEDAKESPYYPTKAGAVWTYKTGDVKFIVKALAKQDKIGLNTCARLETIQDNKVVGSEDVYAQDDGVFRAASDDKQVLPTVCLFKAPPKTGAVWTIDSTANTRNGKETLKGTFKMTKEDKVTTPAGEYPDVYSVSCDDLDANGAKYSFKTYYAKDVGMVKQVIEAGGLKVVIELEKYEPAPK